MRTLVLFASTAVLTATTLLPARALTGLELEKFCDAPHESREAVSCIAYIRGFSDVLYLADWMATNGDRFCPPKGESVNAEQAKSIVQKYLKDHPEQLQ